MSKPLPHLEPCPFCGVELTVPRIVNPTGRCDTEGCWMHERRIGVPLDDANQVETWNRRAASPLLRKPGPLPPGCHCKKFCAAPVIMGHQTPCRRPGGVPGQLAPDPA